MSGTHPAVTDADALDDRDWFEGHPGRAYRLRRGYEGWWIVERRPGGEMQPVEIVKIYAPREGQVRTIRVKPGDKIDKDFKYVEYLIVAAIVLAAAFWILRRLRSTTLTGRAPTDPPR